jgi:hypothetical protein
MVNQYYVYGVDRAFGPFLLKFCSYFPYNAKLCINGHEYVKGRLELQASTKRSTTQSSRVRSRPGYRRSSISFRRRTSMAYLANGSAA